ncbi:MAG: 5'-3' exonuclease [Lentisphaerae bacterium]|nr:5'-3' exonuclease [Lentisphaerota bacterium]MCP4103808.1 5'-3' exonuclease [Lentisphaerota bacterium]
MPKTDILLIDAYSQIFRCFYAIRALSNSRGEPTNAIFGFTKLLLRIDKNYPSEYGALLFDCGKPEFRLELAPDYKANRPPTPEDLKAQVPYLKEVAEAFGWNSFFQEGYEADDLIAVVAAEFNDKSVKFISSDKDLAQLIDERVEMLIPAKTSTGFTIRGTQEVVEKFNVKPEQIIDYLAMIGDSSDNIPGLKGVGPKTAAKLLHEFGSIDNILAEPEKISNAKLRQKVIDNTELLKKNIKLVTLKADIDKAPWQGIRKLKRNQPDWDKIRDFCQRMELHSIIKELPPADDLWSAPPIKKEPPAAKTKQKKESDKFAPDLFGGND